MSVMATSCKLGWVIRLSEQGLLMIYLDSTKARISDYFNLNSMQPEVNVCSLFCRSAGACQLISTPVTSTLS